MTILDKNLNYTDLPVLPFLPKIDLNKKISSQSITSKLNMNLFSVELIRNYFQTSASCAIVTSIFRNIPAMTDAVPKPSVNMTISDFANVPDHVLIYPYRITKAVRHPPCIVQAAKDYIRDILKGSKFIGIHWRFDKKDWAMNCSKSTHKYVKLICKNILNLEPAFAVKKLKLFHEKEMPEMKNILVYVAAPPSADELKTKFYDELSNSNGIFEKPSESLETYLQKRFKHCWKQNVWIYSTADIFSLYEMELMIQSSWFLYSNPSTWSNVARLIRRTNQNVKFEESLADVLLREKETINDKLKISTRM